MARIRTIKPSFFRHRDLYLAEKKSKLPLRVAFAGLFTCADRDGKFKWSPEELKLDCLPFDPVDFEKVLNILDQTGFIFKYEVAGRCYALIPSFLDHQRIRLDEAKSTIPDPPIDTGSLRTRHEPDTTRVVEGKGKERNMERKEDANAVEPKKNSEGKKKGNPPPPPLEEIHYPFTSQRFAELWEQWKEYRKSEFKKKYKSVQSEQATLMHLAKISNGDEQYAIDIIMHSIGNTYQGLFEIKNYNHAANSKNGQQGAVNNSDVQSAFGKIDAMFGGTGNAK